MADDWIKIRISLFTDPKVNKIARELESSPEVSQVLSIGDNNLLSEVVTRNVTRYVTVALLIKVWCAVNEHSEQFEQGLMRNTDLSDIDDIAGLDGFATAMMHVGWLEYDKDNMSVKFPNFEEYNTCGKERARSLNAERQRRHRQKKKNEQGKNNVMRNGLRNVTDNVTRNDREEKRREDIYICSFEQFWTLDPRKVAKKRARKAWMKLKPSSELVDQIMIDIKTRKGNGSWKDKQFIPYAGTYLNEARWEDVPDPEGKPSVNPDPGR